MSIYDTYASILTESIIREILGEGLAPTVGEITNRFTDITDVSDLTQPLFSADDYTVEWRETSSASKWNSCNAAVRQDIDVLYKHLLTISDQSLQNFSRWRIETSLLEKHLDALAERILTLLLVSRDTAGYFNFMQDNFVDLSKVDLDNTSAYINLNQSLVTIGTSNTGATKVDTQNLLSKDVQFAVLSKSLWESDSQTPQSDLAHVVDGTDNYWQSFVRMSAPGTVTVELKVDLQEEKTLSRLDIDLHQSNTSSYVEVMPLLSTDNHNYSQLAMVAFSKSAIDKVTFSFPSISARYVKFLLTKNGHDSVDKQQYVYEFGMDEISFYDEGFAEDVESTFVSQPLSVVDVYGQPQEFSRMVLEVCEDVPTDTSIDYSVAASTVSTTAVSNLSFVGIDPLTRTQGSRPTVLDFGDISTVAVSGLTVSYNAVAGSGTFQCPAESYSLISDVSGTTATVGSGDASGIRYSFQNDNDVILSHTMASGIKVAQDTLELWRNTSRYGMDTWNTRDVRAGWGYEEPYYKTTVYVSNKAGVDIDFGSKPVMIDGVSTTGKATIAAGRHTIWAHEDNWQEIDFGIQSVSDLRDVDSLYPYNHRYLIEGYPYGPSWTEEKVYLGFDIVAQYFMREVSPFDMMYNVPDDGYEYFARDKEVPDNLALLDGNLAAKHATTVFLVKADMENGDLINEDFLLKFKAVTSQTKYVRLKAVMKTLDTEVAPQLESYRIKVSS